MSLDLNQSAENKLARAAVRLILAASLTVGLGLVAVERSHAAYSEGEIRQVQTSQDAKIRELRDQEITQLRITLGRRSPANRRAELYFRLAELYLEAYRAEFILEGRVHERRLEKGISDKFIDRTNSKPYLKKGIQACEELIKLGIAYDKLDQVYYFLGFNHGELGNERQSVRAFETLVARYPRSSFVGEAYRELGEASFNKKDYRKAMGYFEQAARRPLGNSHPRVLHRLAWTYYRTKQFDRAVATLKEAIAKAAQNQEKLLALHEEALRDMAVFMTETGRVEEAVQYFEKVAGDGAYYARALEKLGKQYERNVEPAKAVQVYETLLKTRPDAEATFRVRAKLVDLDLRRARYASALSRIQGVKIPEGGEPETETAAKNLRAMVRRTATEKHDLYRKKKDRAALEVAEKFYQAYLTTFLSQEGSSKETHEIRMYLADVKRELGKSKEASEYYRQVVDGGDARYAKEAAALWTASLSEAIKKNAQKNATEPSALEMEFIDAADALQESLSEAVEGREAALRAAQVLAGYKSRQDDAISRARKITERWPRTQQALTASRLWLQILSDRMPSGLSQLAESDAAEDMSDAIGELRKNSALMAADRELGGSKLKAAMEDHEQRLKVGKIASLEKSQEFATAAKNYETFALEASDRSVADKAYANAMASYVKAGSFDEAGRVQDQWLKRFPNAKDAVESSRQAATAAMIQGEFEQASQLFLRIGRTGLDAASLETAGRIYEGIGSHAKAQGAYSAFVGMYPSSSQKGQVLLALAQSYERAGQDSEAAKTYRECFKGGDAAAAECGARLGDLYQRSQSAEKAKGAWREVAALGGSGKKGGGNRSPYIGYARYQLANLMEREARFEPLRYPQEQLKKAFEQRVEFLERLSRAYNSAADAHGPWGITASDRLGNWAIEFAQALDQVPPPAGANAQSIAQFRKSMASISDPVRKRALETWGEAYRRAVDAEALSPVLPGLADRLAEARGNSLSGAPVRAQGPRARMRLAGGAIDGDVEKIRERLRRNAQDASAWVDYGNRLWGDSKPLLAKLAYERALVLDRKNAAALNNRGVIALHGAAGGHEDWYRSAEGLAFFQQALEQDEFFVLAKANQASLLNYYRVFKKAKPLWDQVVSKAASAEAYDGLGVAQQGLGNFQAAEAAFKKATDLGADDDRFVLAYFEAVKFAAKGRESAAKCVARLEDIDETQVQGFESEAIRRLKETCEKWNAKN